MKCDIMLAGVGGQGILSIAAILGRAALSRGLHVKQSEVHGMAQRGGAVHSHLRIASNPIHSGTIPRKKADIILSMEPMESLRYLDWLSPEGWLITNDQPLENIPDYPPLPSLLHTIEQMPRHLLFDGTKIAQEQNSPRSLNMAMLGAASPFIDLPQPDMEQAIQKQFASKGPSVIEANLRVYQAARAFALSKK